MNTMTVAESEFFLQLWGFALVGFLAFFAGYRVGKSSSGYDRVPIHPMSY